MVDSFSAEQVEFFLFLHLPRWEAVRPVTFRKDESELRHYAGDFGAESRGWWSWG
jgi:hypothetical protein